MNLQSFSVKTKKNKAFGLPKIVCTPPKSQNSSISINNQTKGQRITLELAVIQNVISKTEKEEIKAPRTFIDTKMLSDENRTRLMDWMIQVFRVLGNSSPQTFFIASSLLDRYFEAKTQQKVHVPSEKLY